MSFFARMLGVVGAFTPLVACANPVDDPSRLARIESMYDTYAIAFSSVEAIEAADLKQRMATEVPPLVVDVRPRDERKVSVIPGSISSTRFEAEAERYRARSIVVYCTIGARSGTYASKLKKEGFDVLNLRGSLLSWTHVGGELVDLEGKPTRQVHVYGKRWDLVAKGYEGVITDSDGKIHAP